MLFQAQKHPQPFQEEPIDTPMATATPSNSRQSSLHSFWSLPTRLASRPSSSHIQPHIQSPPFPPPQNINCFSCDVRLVNEDGDAMDIDAGVEAGFSDFYCSQCHKPVCHSCSIPSLGAQRHCLGCAPRLEQKRWVGGLGWVMDERGQMQRRWM